MKTFTQDQVVAQLRSLIETGTQLSLAAQIGISRTFLCEVLRGTRPPTGKILDHLGLQSKTIYFKKGDDQ